MKTGEIVALLGRSGSGKSTLLRLISGLTRPTQGTVKIGGAPVDGPAKDVAMVFQSFALFPWLDVLDNVEIGPRANGVPLDRDAQTRFESDRHHRPRRIRIRLPEGAVGRHAPARRFRTRARDAAEDPLDGRAVLRARCAHRGNPAHRSARPLAGRAHTDQIHPDGHPQYRGGGADGRPRPGAVLESRPHRRRDPRSPSRIRATGSTRSSAISWRRSTR